MYKIADINDIEIITKLPIHFHYIKNAVYELTTPEIFRWILKIESGKVVALHRSIVINETGFLAGIYLDYNSNETFLCLDILKQALIDLRKKPIKYLRSVADPKSPKNTLLKHFGFQRLLSCYMLFLPNRKEIDKVNLLAEGWDMSEWTIIQDYQCQFKNVLLDPYFNDISYKESYWCLNNKSGALINWFIYGNTIEILYCFSQDIAYNFTKGIIKIIHDNCLLNSLIEQIRILIPSSSISSYIELCRYGFSLYNGNQMQFIYYQGVSNI